jgi:transcriptional regulator with XRE-family HTH domain
MHTPQQPAIRLRVPEFRRRAARAGLKGDEEIGVRLGMSRTSIGRVTAGTVAPGAKFIAAAMSSLNARFDELFVVEPRGGGLREKKCPRGESGGSAGAQVSALQA